jgi:predicted nucleotidyltransferase
MSSIDSRPETPTATPPPAIEDLPVAVRGVLTEFIDALVTVAGPALESVLLFGSAAEGRLRPTSDLNVLVMAASIDAAQLNALREPLRCGRAAAGLTVMFLEDAEFADACECFAMKFGDIKARHRVLYGRDPFTAFEIPRAAAIRRLQQVLLNLKLRLRERYALDGDQNDRLAASLADITGPVRVSAAALLALRDGQERPPKTALEEFCSDARWTSCLAGLSAVHRGEVLPADTARALVGDVLALLSALGAAAAALLAPAATPA